MYHTNQYWPSGKSQISNLNGPFKLLFTPVAVSSVCVCATSCHHPHPRPCVDRGHRVIFEDD